MRVNRRDTLIGLAGCATGAALAAWGARQPRLRPGVAGQGIGPLSLPNVVLTTHEGRTVRFYDDLLRNRIVLVNFMYARCSGTCPAQTANLRRVQLALGDRAGREVYMYSLTLKPREDTPDVLRRYARRHGIEPGWLFLTGSADDIELLRRRLGFTDPDPVVDADTSSHIGMVVLGNEPLQRWMACPALTEPALIVTYLDWMMPPTRRWEF